MSLTKGLAAKSLLAMKNNYLGTVVRVAAQFIAQIIIMRELGPELVGVFGYALLMYGVLALVIDQGFGWSLVKGNFDDSKEIAIAFSRVMLASLVSAVFVYAVSYPIEALLSSPLIGSVFRYSAPSYLLIGLFVVAQARLRAELRFKEVQFATTGSYVVAYPIVGVTMAFQGLGVWALLGAWYTQAILQVLIAYLYCPHSLRLTNPFLPTQSGPLGRNVAAINIVNWAVEGASGIFVGGLGAAALGNFNAAVMVAKTPALQLVQVLQSVLFSTASSLGSNRANIKRLYLGSVAVVSFVVIPAYAYASTHATPIIHLLFGAKWLHAAGILSALSLGMIALALSSISGAILTASGKQNLTLLSQFACLAALFLGLLFAANINLILVGVAISAAYWLRFAIQLKGIANANSIRPTELVTIAKGPFAIALLMALPFSALYPDVSILVAETAAIVVKLILAVVLLRLFPNFFFSPPLTDVLTKLPLGRRLAKWFGAQAT